MNETVVLSPGVLADVTFEGKRFEFTGGGDVYVTGCTFIRCDLTSLNEPSICVSFEWCKFSDCEMWDMNELILQAKV